MALIKHLPGMVFAKTEVWCWTASLVSRSAIWTGNYQFYDQTNLVLTDKQWKTQQTVPTRAPWVRSGERVMKSDKKETGPYKTKLYWVFEGKTYETLDPDLTPEDVSALVNEAANRRRLQLEKARSLQAMTQNLDGKGRREAIPQDVKVSVWQRDGGRCVECGSAENLEFDHIIPLSMGGANTFRNLQLLCEPCNRRKGASLG